MGLGLVQPLQNIGQLSYGVPESLCALRREGRLRCVRFVTPKISQNRSSLLDALWGQYDDFPAPIDGMGFTVSQFRPFERIQNNGHRLAREQQLISQTSRFGIVRRGVEAQ